VHLEIERGRQRPRIYCSTSLDAAFMASPDARYIELCVPPDGLRLRVVTPDKDGDKNDGDKGGRDASLVKVQGCFCEPLAC
jgi:hypothetical protein